MLPSPSIASLGARFRGGVAVIVPLVLTLVAYGPSMHGPFVFDGVSEIARNEGLRTLWPPWVPMFTGGQLPQRPLPYLSFALNLAACGIEPFGWHLVNVAIHLGNGLLAWFVVREILARTAPGDGGATAGRRAAAIAWAVATLWLVHPLCTQAVSYLYQRIELLAATCILASLACQLRADDSPRPHAWRCGSILACATGMLCKESAAAAPLVLLLVAWLAGPRPAGWRSLVATLRSGTPYWAALAATWLVAAAVVFVQRDRFGEFARPKWTPLEYALQQPRSILRYLQLAIWPRGQCVDYGWLPVPWPRMLPGWTALGVLVAAFVRSAGRCPRLAIAIGSFLILLGPTSSLLPVIDLCVEHRMYLPLLPLVAIVCVAVDAAVRRWWPGLSAALLPAAVGCGLVLAAVTFARNGVWSSAEGLWQDAVEKEPDNPRAAVNLAAALLHEGRFAAAAAIASRGLAVEPAPTGAMRASLLTWLARGRSGAARCRACRRAAARGGPLRTRRAAHGSRSRRGRTLLCPGDHDRPRPCQCLQQPRRHARREGPTGSDRAHAPGGCRRAGTRSVPAQSRPAAGPCWAIRRGCRDPPPGDGPAADGCRACRGRGRAPHARSAGRRTGAAWSVRRPGRVIEA